MPKSPGTWLVAQEGQATTVLSIETLAHRWHSHPQTELCLQGSLKRSRGRDLSRGEEAGAP